jgi:hypothetical protein
MPAPQPPDAEALKTIGEYLRQKVIRRLSAEETKRTRFWIPVFTRPKKNSDKVRLITDLRKLNECHAAQKHKAENWNLVCETIRDPRWQWGLTLDLKSFFHHLQMGPKLQRWMRFRLGHQAFQITAMPFGWSLSPYWAHRLARPIREWLNQQKWAHCWWVDDILLLGETKAEVEHRATALVDKLTQLGMAVNTEKSMTQAAQRLTYLGHQIDLSKNVLIPEPEKAKHVNKAVRKMTKGNNFPPVHLAALAGALLDAQRSNAALHGLPQQVMKAAAKGVQVNKERFHTDNVHKCWRTTTTKT